jgi:hypothetical protein
MEAAKAVFHAVVAISAARIAVGLGAVALTCIALGLRAWRDDSLGRLADNVLGVHMLMNMALYLLVVSLFFYFDGLLFGVAVGWLLAIPVTLFLGYMFRWYVEFNIWVAVCLAGILGLPQPGSIFNDPRALAAMGEFLRKHSTDSPEPTTNKKSPE